MKPPSTSFDKMRGCSKNSLLECLADLFVILDWAENAEDLIKANSSGGVKRSSYFSDCTIWIAWGVTLDFNSNESSLIVWDFFLFSLNKLLKLSYSSGTSNLMKEVLFFETSFVSSCALMLEISKSLMEFYTLFNPTSSENSKSIFYFSMIRLGL